MRAALPLRGRPRSFVICSWCMRSSISIWGRVEGGEGGMGTCQGDCTRHGRGRVAKDGS